jgi:competence protein ComEC
MLTGMLAAPTLAGVATAGRVQIAGGVILGASVVILVVSVCRPRYAPIFDLAIIALSAWLGVARSVVQNGPGRLLPARAGVRAAGQIADSVEWQPSAMTANGSTGSFAVFFCDVGTARFGSSRRTRKVLQRVRVTIEADQPLPLMRGDYVQLSGTWRRIAHATNPGEFDAATHYARLDVHYQLRVRNGEVTWSTPPQLSPWLRLRRALDRLRLDGARVLGAVPGYETEASILRRMTLGTREALPEDATAALERTSTFHIIAISGLHLGIVGGLWYCVAWLLGVPGRWRGAAIVPLLWLYALMVGPTASVVRAMLMFTVFACAPLARRAHNGAHTLIVAAFIYLLIQPAQLGSIGTLLTFISVLALIAGLAPVNDLVLRWRWVRGPAVYDLEHRHLRAVHVILKYFVQIACGTLVVWSVTWPIVVGFRNLVAPCSWLANLVVVPLLTVVLGLGFFTLLISAVLPWVAHFLQMLNVFILHGMLRFMYIVSAIPWGSMAVRSLTPLTLICYYLAIILTWRWLVAITRARAATPHVRRRNAIACVCAWALVAAIWLRTPTADGTCRIVALDVGLGDALVVHGPAGETLVIDGGTRMPAWSVGARIVTPYLRAMGVRRVDAVICSHFDRDHCGGLRDVVRQCRAGVIVAPPDVSDTPLARELRATAEALGVAWHTCCAGDSFQWGRLSADILHPPDCVTNLPARAVLRRDNTWSLVARLTCGDRSLLATGDATLAAEALQLLAPAQLRANVLKIAHHGSATSTGGDYLDAVRPAIALVSVGAGNPALPSAAVLRRCRARRIKVVRTDRLGAVCVELARAAAHIYAFEPYVRTGTRTD